MILLFLLIAAFIVIAFSSTTMSSNLKNRPDITASTAPSTEQDLRVKRTAVVDNIPDEIMPIYFDKLNTLERLFNEKLQNQLDTVTVLNRKLEARITTLSRHMLSIEGQITTRMLQTISRQLRISSQCFGASYTRLNAKNTLDQFNSQLYNISHYDICAIQDLNVPQSRWYEKGIGVMEIFKPILEKRGHYLLLKSFACIKGKKNDETCYTSFGFYINPCFNFQFNIETDVETILNEDNVGVLLIRGTLFDQYDAVFGCIRGGGAVDDNEDNYNNEENINIVKRVVNRIAEIRPHFYTLIGDFKLRHSVFINAMTSSWRQTLTDMCCESDVLSNGSLLSSFDKHGYSQPDHILTNMHIVDLRLFQVAQVDRMRIESVLYPMHQKMTSTRPSNTRKLNVQLRQDSVKF